jgi:hypothetical protein
MLTINTERRETKHVNKHMVSRFGAYFTSRVRLGEEPPLSLNFSGNFIFQAFLFICVSSDCYSSYRHQIIIMFFIFAYVGIGMILVRQIAPPWPFCPNNVFLLNKCFNSTYRWWYELKNRAISTQLRWMY